jgi:hypothetical protein
LKQSSFLTYHSKRTGKRAKHLSKIAEKGYSFLHEFFQAEIEMPLLVINQKDWGKRTEYPYGVIFAEKGYIHFPADQINQYTETMQPLYDHCSKENRKALIELVGEDKYPLQRALGAYLDTKIVHELTHVFMEKRRVVVGSHWFNEFICDYANYALFRRYPGEFADSLRLQEAFPGIFYEAALPEVKFRSVSDFDRLYYRVGWANFQWYFCRSMRGIYRLYDVYGEGFLRDVVDVFGVSTESLLARLDSRRVGLGQWFANWFKDNP